MQSSENSLGRFGVFLLVGLFFGMFAFAGCEKAKPTVGEQVGEQVGNAIDETIKATGQAATDIQTNTKEATNNFQDKLDQASRNISKETTDLRDAVKQAVDDHLTAEKSK